MYNDKYIKTRVKIYNDRVYTNFQHNKICYNNYVNSNKEYYPQIFFGRM